MSNPRLTPAQRDDLILWLADAADTFCLKQERDRETRGTKAIRAFTATLVEALAPPPIARLDIVIGEDIGLDD